MTKRVALYLRVSTGDQSVENQRRELLTVAERQGWSVVAEFCDEGVSGAKGRDKRPGFDCLCKAITRRDIDLVMVWSVDRLSRSLPDLVAFLGELRAKCVDLFLLLQNLDTSTPSGRAMFGMLGVFSEFERAMIRERVMAGMARARSQGKALGRPKVLTEVEAAVAASLRDGMGIIRAAKLHGVGVGTAQRIKTANAKSKSRSPEATSRNT